MKFVSAYVSTGFKSWMKNLGLNPVYKSNNYDANVMPWGQISLFFLKKKKKGEKKRRKIKFIFKFIKKHCLQCLNMSTDVCVCVYIYMCVCGLGRSFDSQSISCCNGNGSIY